MAFLEKWASWSPPKRPVQAEQAIVPVQGGTFRFGMPVPIDTIALSVKPDPIETTPVPKQRRSGAGRPKKAVTDRGLRGGFNTNKIQLGQSPLRRDPGVASRLAMVARVAAAVERYGGVDQVHISEKRSIEEFSGHAWKPFLVTQYHNRVELQKRQVNLRLGKYGPNPFGSRRSKQSRKSLSTGARALEKQLLD